MNFPFWYIVFLRHSLGVPIFVVRVGIFLDMGVGIHRGSWGRTFSWRGRRSFYDHGSSLFLFHSIGHRSNKHPKGNIFSWIL